MVTWKVVLVVIVIAILLMVMGIWLGYRYISEQDDIDYQARNQLPCIEYFLMNTNTYSTILLL